MNHKLEFDRRDLLKKGAGVAALALGGGPPLLSSRGASGAVSTQGTAATCPDAQTKILSGSKDYDCWETIGERLPSVVQTKNVEPIPAGSIKNWSNIRDTFTKADPKWDRKSQIVGQIWKDDAEKS